MVDAIVQEGSMTLYSVAGRSLEPLNNFATTYKIENKFIDYHSLINDPDVDVI